MEELLNLTTAVSFCYCNDISTPKLLPAQPILDLHPFNSPLKTAKTGLYTRNI